MTYGYLRVSSDKQDVESQKIGVDKKASELGLNIDAYIKDEGVSGAKEYGKRKLGDLLNNAREGDIIIVSEISRLARSVFMLFRIVEYCMDNNIVVYSVKDSINTLKKGDLIGMMAVFFFGIAAQIEREMIIKRTIEGLERRRKEGVIFGRPVGAKGKNNKLNGKEELVKQYVAAGLNVSQTARMLKVHQETLRRFCRDKGIGLNPREIPVGFLSLQQQDNNRWIKISKTNAAFFDSRKEHILSMIDEGLTQKYIVERLEEKTDCPKISESSLREWMKKVDLYGCLVQKQRQLRNERNRDCGKSKPYYKQ
jgi:DNA invertase Pin-like site-specific DNA recombinase